MEAARDLLRAGRCHALVVARDASPRACERLVRLARARGVVQVEGPDAESLGARLGRPPVMAVGVRDRKFAEGILRTAAAR